MRCFALLFLLAAAGAASGCQSGPLARFERSVVYRPQTARADWPDAEQYGFEEARFTAADGTRLHGWFRDHPQRRAVVLYLHGNGGNVVLCSSEVHHLAETQQVAVLVFDYRGYGLSEGQPDETGLLADARAARAWLAERTGIPQQRVLLMGRSLGGAVAVDLASEDGAAALVVLNSFTSLPDVAREHFSSLPAGWMMRQRFNSLGKIGNYDGPLLIGHGDADTLIPFEHGQQLFEAAGSTHKRLVPLPGKGHNDPPGPDWDDELARFLASLPPGGLGSDDGTGL